MSKYADSFPGPQRTTSRWKPLDLIGVAYRRSGAWRLKINAPEYHLNLNRSIRVDRLESAANMIERLSNRSVTYHFQYGSYHYFLAEIE